MNIRATAVALMTLGAAVVAGATGALDTRDAQAWPANRIIVHVAGPHAGTIDFDVSPSLLPEVLTDIDTGEVIMPTNYCGLRIKKVGALHWDDGFGNLIEAESHGEVTVSGNGYYFMGEEISEYYFGGMEFTGALDTCDTNHPWHFPTPLSYGGNGPQYGAARLILELDQTNAFPTIEFLDHAFEPVELPDLYEDWEPPAGIEEYCEQIPEFCEEEDPDPPTVELEIVWGCILSPDNCPEPDPATPAPGFTLGCMAYSIGCDPDPQPIGNMKVQGDGNSDPKSRTLIGSGTNLQMAGR